MDQIERIDGWSWDVHAVATAYNVPPSVVRREWSLYDVQETAAHILIARIAESI